jgi:hypothetical protein
MVGGFKALAFSIVALNGRTIYKGSLVTLSFLRFHGSGA